MIEQMPAWEHPRHNNKPLGGPAGECRVIGDGVVPDTVRGVNIPVGRRPLEFEPPLDLAEEDQILGQPEGGRGEEDLPVPEELFDREVAPDLSRTVKAPGEEGFGVGDERGFNPFAALDDPLGMKPEQRIETPGVVEMTMRNGDIFDAEEVDPHLSGVLNEDTRVAGVEEDVGPAVLDVDREPGLREEVPVGEGGVIHENRQSHAQCLQGIQNALRP